MRRLGAVPQCANGEAACGEGRAGLYKVPRLLAFVDDMSNTGSEKILRRALRVPLSS